MTVLYDKFGNKVVNPTEEQYDEIWNYANRQVGSEYIEDYHVSTVHLPIDHGYNGPVLIFETMIFHNGDDVYTERYSTWGEAEAGHREAVRYVKEQLLHNVRFKM